MDVKIKGFTVFLIRKTWSDQYIDIAKCIGFEYKDVDTIVCNLKTTSKVSLYWFLSVCMKPFMESARYKEKREKVFEDIKELYVLLRSMFDSFYNDTVDYPHKLYPHQRDAIFDMMPKKYNLLSFEQGLGKTITSATMSKITDINRTVVICPALIKWNWYHELVETWGFNQLYISVLDRNQDRMVEATEERFCIVNYEMLGKYWPYITGREVDHIIVDECHYIKSHKTKRYKHVEALVRKYPNARVTLMSGTPVTNRVNDFYAYLKLINHPLGKTHKGFLDRYTYYNQGRRGLRVYGAKNVDDLRLKLSNFMIRRKAEECLSLPDLIIQKYYFKMEEYAEEYKKALEELYQSKKRYDSLSDKAKAVSNLSTNLHTLNRIVATSKVLHIIKLIDNLNEQGKKVIVFSSYKDPINQLLKHYGREKAVKIDGSVSAYDRDQNIQKFKKDDNCMVFLGNTKAAGVGINLTNSNHVIFMNFPFTPDELEQPYKRAHRIGQKGKVFVYYTICEDSIDENIYGLIENKTKDINDLIDKDKKGVIRYDSIPNKLFKILINKYEKQYANTISA